MALIARTRLSSMARMVIPTTSKSAMGDAPVLASYPAAPAVGIALLPLGLGILDYLRVGSAIIDRICRLILD